LYNYFLSKTNTQHTSSVPEEWERIEAETRKATRLGHLSYRTEKAYIGWLRRFRAFVGERSPFELGGDEFQEFLTYFVLKKRTAPSTQKRAEIKGILT
jgi:hypothetical protein